jgi:hypothetical protein
MRSWTSWVLASALAGTAIVATPPAHAQYRPEVPVLKCAHQGEPVPGIAGAAFQYFNPPGIDAAGNVLICASMTGPGITSANDEGIWYGQPGAMTLLARDGWAAPDLPGVVFSSVTGEGATVSENGWIVFTAYLTGSGVTPDVNNCAVFCGPPGDFRLVLRTGDPVPEIGPDVAISGTDLVGACISDNGTLLIGAGITGPGLPPPTPRAYWSGPRGAVELAAWEGMPVPDCPDCPPGAYLSPVTDFRFNDAGQVSFNGRIVGDGVDPFTNRGRWLGIPGALHIALRQSDLAPDFGPGVTVWSPFAGLPSLNASGDMVSVVFLYGPGIGANYTALVGGETDPVAKIAQVGDPAPEAGEGTYLTGVGNPYINNLHEVFFQGKFAGPGIDDSNRYGNYLGPYGSPRLIQRCGQSADYFAPGTTLDAGLVAGTASMNDVGDFAAVAQTVSAGGAKTEMLGAWRALTDHFIPLIQTGSQVLGRTVTLSDFYGLYNMETGGADGMLQSFNDRRQLATLLDFTDGTTGVYRVGPPLLGDTDADGEVGAAELLTFAGCAAGPGGSVAPGCEALDLNLDGTVDVTDFALFQAMVAEPR